MSALFSVLKWTDTLIAWNDLKPILTLRVYNEQYVLLKTDNYSQIMSTLSPFASKSGAVMTPPAPMGAPPLRVLWHLSFLFASLVDLAHLDCFSSCHCTLARLFERFCNGKRMCTGWRSVGMEERWSDAEHNQLDAVRAVHRAPATTHWLRRPNQSRLPLTAALCVAIVHSAYILYIRYTTHSLTL